MQKTGEDRTVLENQATDARLRLEDRLRALFERRRYWSARARRVIHPPTTALLVAAFGLTALVFVTQRRKRRRPQGLRRPEVLALLRSQPVALKGFWRQTLEMTGRTLLADAARQLGRRSVVQLLHHAPALANGPAPERLARHGR
jgi:hypothetical protein